MKIQVQAPKPMIYQHFEEEAMTKISRTFQNIAQVLRDTLRWGAS
jgi:hypothetical protein